jgi:uncharacterized protein (DUF1499 family)
MQGRLGVVAAIAFLVGPALAWLRLVPGLFGFAIMGLGGLLALGVAVAALVRLVRGRGLTAGGAAAIVITVVFVFLASRSAGVPRINDYTTDPGDPPVFVHALALPANVGRNMDYPAAFAAEQHRCCADLHPIHLAVPPPDAFARARAVAEAMPRWTVIATDQPAGVIEAVAESALFGFQDDVIIRLRPDGPAGTRIDVRSKSRDGKGDLGTNAARIRAYSAALQRADGVPRP